MNIAFGPIHARQTRFVLNYIRKSRYFNSKRYRKFIFTALIQYGFHEERKHPLRYECFEFPKVTRMHKCNGWPPLHTYPAINEPLVTNGPEWILPQRKWYMEEEAVTLGRSQLDHEISHLYDIPLSGYVIVFPEDLYIFICVFEMDKRKPDFG